MPKYGYLAIDNAGVEKKGTIEAEDTAEARQELKRKSLTVIRLSEQSVLNQDLNIQIGGRPKPRDLSVMCRQFVSMTKAGVTILEALKLLSVQTENVRLRDAIREVRVSVEKGEGLAASFAKFPKVFPSLMVNMVAAGEASGNLDTAMERMATQFERSNKTQAMVKKAMIYPIVIICVTIIITIVLLVVVIPRYETMFQQLDTQLPGLTQFYVNMSRGLIDKWFIILPVVIGAAAGISAFSKTNPGRHLFGWVALHIPIFGKLVIKSASSLMSRTLSTLTSSGVPLIEAVDIVSGLMSNIYFKEALEQAREDITVGMPLSVPLETCKLFPPMVYHMIRIGEEAGNTEEMLDKLADYYDEEVEMAVQSVMAALEPMIIIVLAFVVGGMVAACLLPMMNMYAALDAM